MNWLGSLVCKLRGKHKWRNLHKGERKGQIDANWRICDRCEMMRTARIRKPKETT